MALPSPARLEAFTDGVVAIIVTIMVLELKVPHSAEPAALLAIWPVFLAYALSFVMVGIYWVNHHHLFKAVRHVDDHVLWANLLVLFFLSLIPFTSGYMSENHFAPFPTAIYAISMLLPALAYLLMTVAIRGCHPDWDAQHAHLIGPAATRRNFLSIAAYVPAIGLAFVHPALSLACIVFVAGLWTVPNFVRSRAVASQPVEKL